MSLIRTMNIKWECTGVNFTESETLNFDPSKTFIGQAPLNISFATRNSVWSSAKRNHKQQLYLLLPLSLEG